MPIAIAALAVSENSSPPWALVFANGVGAHSHIKPEPICQLAPRWHKVIAITRNVFEGLSSKLVTVLLANTL
ncbi:hypothetical protein BS47DRAFT_1355273 [Hydnum rufescens UP504]|uniref:Uncharacterized protein n=1 Tax=Hydnum rufescens UP504 TaxID=1448309 RepID=A0A9P6DMS5_9AGAM|nr:hypothetical protein BS47DRAFT_1355273 [Hydnum rufescens UP504]